MKRDLLKLEDLAAGYGSRVVVDGLTLTLPAGQIMTLIGPNGAGKSTILKTLAGELAPLGGTALLDGKNIYRMQRRERALQMAVVLTGGIRTESMTCREIVEKGRYPHTGTMGRLTPKDQEAVARALAATRSAGLADRIFSRISDGQRQRVLLACALCQEPRFLLLDEPTSYLDLHGKLEFMELLLRLCHENGMTAVMSIHELDLARKVSDQILCIRDGRADRIGKPEDVFKGGYIADLFDVSLQTMQRFGMEYLCGQPQEGESEE